MSHPIVFETDLADNPEPRCPCVLLLDVSHSMAGAPIRALNDGLETLRDALAEDALALKRVELAIVTFGPVEVPLPFTGAERFVPPKLGTKGNTPMGEAILTGLSLVTERKSSYRQHGLSYYRPWIFLITDGAPTDDWRTAAEAVRAGEANSDFAFFAIGVDGANMDTLGQIAPRGALPLRGLHFRELFLWLSSSLRSVSQSSPGDRVRLPPPDTGEGGWTFV